MMERQPLEIRRDVAALAALLDTRRVVALTGAGCSTESGIPDYRGPETRRRARNPIKYQEYIGDPARRRRYWARSMMGWPRFSSFAPNQGHRALASMEHAGVLTGLITQNVDRLHQEAGSHRVVELHGAMAEVACLDCQAVEPRHSLQARLHALNPGWEATVIELAPDGDAVIPEALIDTFRVAGCRTCRGTLKPDVVFFGESIKRAVHEAADAMMAEADALLIVGSSLAVYSGYRFLREASRRRMPVGVINLGALHRGNELVDVHVDAPAGEALSALRDALMGARP